ncbi:hypothetical protein ACFXJ5_13810 [Streptomyces sp. NPDC059373]
MTKADPTDEDLMRQRMHDLAEAQADGGPFTVAPLLARGRRARRVRRVTTVCASAALVVVAGSVLGLSVTDGGGTDRTSVAAPTTSPTASQSPLPARTLAPDHLQLGPAHPSIGTSYRFDLPVHCGIRYAEFGGRSWQTDQDVKVPTPTPDPTTGITTATPMLPGYMTLVTATTARFEMPGLIPVTFHVLDHDVPLCA